MGTLKDISPTLIFILDCCSIAALSIVLGLLLNMADSVGTLGAALRLLKAPVPLIAIICTCFVYITAHTMWQDSDLQINYLALTAGHVAGFIALILFAYLYKSSAYVDRANISVYNELCQRLDRLGARLEVSCRVGEEPDSSACIEARRQWSVAKRKLKGDPGNGQPPIDVIRLGETRGWAMGWGYIDIWKVIHLAEEALIEVEPVASVIRMAVHDELRLINSKIENRNLIMAKLQQAVSVLSGQAVQYLNSPSPTMQSTQQPLATEQEEKQARAILREVRRNINEFRDTRREGLVQARNHLLEKVTLTSMASYIALVLGILVGVTPNAMAATCWFFIIGALVGLFKRLRDDSATNLTSEEDYGFARARLIHTPLVSGLGAIGGVMVFALAPLLLNSNLISPPASSSAVATGANVAILVVPTDITTAISPGLGLAPDAISSPSQTEPLNGTMRSTPSKSYGNSGPAMIPPTVQLSQAHLMELLQPQQKPSVLEYFFDLKENPIGLLIAAVFGMVPSLLIGALQRQVEEYKKDLKSTEASEGDSGKAF